MVINERNRPDVEAEAERATEGAPEPELPKMTREQMERRSGGRANAHPNVGGAIVRLEDGSVWSWRPDIERWVQTRSTIRGYAKQSDAERLRDLLVRSGFSQRGAARELDISERMMRYYCAGEQPVPKVVMLAVEHLGCFKVASLGE